MLEIHWQGIKVRRVNEGLSSIFTFNEKTASFFFPGFKLFWKQSQEGLFHENPGRICIFNFKEKVAILPNEQVIEL